jgi:acyl-CoA hydrolase
MLLEIIMREENMVVEIIKICRKNIAKKELKFVETYLHAAPSRFTISELSDVDCVQDMARASKDEHLLRSASWSVRFRPSSSKTS